MAFPKVSGILVYKLGVDLKEKKIIFNKKMN